MNQLNSVNGRCLCGAIRFVVNGTVDAFHLCHCTRCRHATGSAHASNIFTSPDNINWIAGEDQIQRFELPTADRWMKQFCKICGGPVPYINKTVTRVVIPAGSLEGEIGLEADDRIFCGETTKWIDTAKNKPEFSEYPVK